MNYQQHFKPEDIETAMAEVKCIEDLFRLTKLNLQSGKFEQANRRLVELLNSIKRLEQMNIDKQHDDEFKSVVSGLLKTVVEQRGAFFVNQSLGRYFNE